MSLYFITGVSGAGKSSIVAELNRRGFEAYDIDEAGPVTAKWHNDKTGYIHPKSSVDTKARTPEFIKEHSWKVPRQEVEELANQSIKKPVFVCGVNEHEIRDLFNLIFALVIDEDTLKHRLTNRNNNDWGKQPHELQQSIDYNHRIGQEYDKHNYIKIDGTQPIEKVVDEILSYTHEN